MYCACRAKCIFADPLQPSHACHRFWNAAKIHTFGFLLTRCRIPCLNVQKWTERGMLSKCSISQLPQVLRSYGTFTIFTSKRASRHSGVHFLNSSTSKSAPKMRCFDHCTSKCASRHTSVHFFGTPTFKSATMSLIQPDGSAPAALASLLLRRL